MPGVESQELPFGETPREAAARRKREAADRERDRVIEATIEHAANNPIKRKASAFDAASPAPAAALVFPDPEGYGGSASSSSRTWRNDDGENLREAARRRKRDESDRLAANFFDQAARENGPVGAYARGSAFTQPHFSPRPRGLDQHDLDQVASSSISPVCKELFLWDGGDDVFG